MCEASSLYLGLTALTTYASHQQAANHAEKPGKALADAHDLEQQDLARMQRQQYDANAPESNAAAPKQRTANGRAD
jgi:hypothetical protein